MRVAVVGSLTWVSCRCSSRRLSAGGAAHNDESDVKSSDVAPPSLIRFAVGAFEKKFEIRFCVILCHILAGLALLNYVSAAAAHTTYRLTLSHVNLK